jgi:hypothetical protein
MKTIKLISIGVLALAACGGDDKGTPDAPKSADANTTPDAFVTPAAPKLGAQIDRMGRPAINTALDHAFDANDTTKQAAKDAYNAAADPSKWATTTLGSAQDTIPAEFAGNLGVIDALDSSDTQSGCSSNPNKSDATRQPLYSTSATGAAAYAGLAGALADDELYVYTGTGTCTLYLGVEGAAILGLATPNDCGGRAPTYDVIDVSYTALAIGLGPVLSKQLVGDGIASDDAPKANDATFPFLGAPHS